MDKQASLLHGHESTKSLKSQLSRVKGAFTLAQFRARFRTKLAHLEMKNIFIYFAKRASLMRNRMRKSLM